MDLDHKMVSIESAENAQKNIFDDLPTNPEKSTTKLIDNKTSSLKDEVSPSPPGDLTPL